MTQPVRLIHAESIPLAVVRRRASRSELARLVPECCGIVWNLVRQDGLRAGRNVAVYWNEAIDLEVGVEVEGRFDGAGEVVASETPGGTVLTTTHFGPYDGLGAAHGAIQGWAAAQRLRLAGPNWEIYGHWQPEWNENPSLIITDVCYQVATGEPG